MSGSGGRGGGGSSCRPRASSSRAKSCGVGRRRRRSVSGRRRLESETGESAQTECTDRQRKAAAHLVPEHLLPDGGVLVAPRLSAGRTRGQRSAPGGATRQDRKGKGGGGGAAAADCAPAAAGIVAGTWDACTYVEWTKTSMPTLIRGAAKAQRRRSLPWGTGSQDGFKKRSRFRIKDLESCSPCGASALLLRTVTPPGPRKCIRVLRVFKFCAHSRRILASCHQPKSGHSTCGGAERR